MAGAIRSGLRYQPDRIARDVRARCHSVKPIALHVVSMPAMSTRPAIPSTRLSSTGAPSWSVWASWLIRSSRGLSLRSLEMFDQEPEDPVASPPHSSPARRRIQGRRVPTR